MKNAKSEKYKELKSKRNTKEYESWFLRYIPLEESTKKQDMKLDKKSCKNKTRSKGKGKTRKSKGKTKKNLINLLF